MRLWTFQIVGGEPFSVEVPNNPRLVHDGDLTLYHVMGTKSLVQSVEEIGESFNCRVLYRGEIETPDQTAYHQRYLESQASVFPCLECTKCFWLDLQAEGYCGLESWGSIAKEQSLKWHPRSVRDASACPLGRGELVTE